MHGAETELSRQATSCIVWDRMRWRGRWKKQAVRRAKYNINLNAGRVSAHQRTQFFFSLGKENELHNDDVYRCNLNASLFRICWQQHGLAALLLVPYGRVGPGSLVSWAVWKSWVWQPCYLGRMEELGLAALFIGPYGRVGPGSLVAWSVLNSWAWQPVYSI